MFINHCPTLNHVQCEWNPCQSKPFLKSFIPDILLYFCTPQGCQGHYWQHRRVGEGGGVRSKRHGVYHQVSSIVIIIDAFSLTQNINTRFDTLLSRHLNLLNVCSTNNCTKNVSLICQICLIFFLVSDFLPLLLLHFMCSK